MWSSLKKLEADASGKIGRLLAVEGGTSSTEARADHCFKARERARAV
jgi:hypothetical protein